MNDQTRQFGVPDRDPDRDGTQRGGAGQQRPRQHFPDQSQSETRYQSAYQPEYETRYGSQQSNAGYEPYDEPYRPDGYNSNYAYDEAPRKQSGGRGPLILGILLALAVLAGIVLFFMWRSAAEEANQPPPAPVTVTQTQTETTTENAPIIPTDILPRDDQGNPQLPSDIPTEIPPEVSNGAQDAQAWLDGLLGDIEGALQGQ
ncbi:hypothetical protein [Corynebacterium lubricantis]|uniref:hypothetical protein n=1 Tax=Corynebacterium lubricantis TaxID=541095 RepID=UPI0003700F64|nr:hypothetical protein [Corynebacterium lubricantis]